MPARTDLTTDTELRAALQLARHGQAYFSRRLAGLRAADFAEPSGLDGWTVAHVVAHVGLNARALTRLTEWARTGIETPMYDSPAQRGEEIELAATLPVQALRNLSEHAAIHLNVEWRDLTEQQWSNEIVTAQGRRVPVSETVWMRTREVWIHSVDLRNGGSFDDFPAELVDRIIEDVARSWQKPAARADGPTLVLTPTDRGSETIVTADSDHRLELRGRSSDIAGWVTGRSARGVTRSDGSPAPAARRWL